MSTPFASNVGFTSVQLRIMQMISKVLLQQREFPATSMLDNHEATPTQTSHLYPPVASPTAMSLEPVVFLCTASDASCLFHNCHSTSKDTTDHRELGTSNLSGSCLEASLLIWHYLHSSERRTASFVELARSHTSNFRLIDMSSLLGRELINFVHEKLLRTLNAAGLSAARSACSSCARHRCRLTLSDHRLPLPHPSHQICQLFLWAPQHRQPVSSHLLEMLPGTVPRALRTLPVAERRKRPLPQLSALPTRSTVLSWPTRRFSFGAVLSSGWTGAMARAQLAPP